jgi:hypothetical protein
VNLKDVLEGCFKVFYQDENGREHILYFAIEDWWVLDIDSFVSGKTSKLYIQALKILLFSQSTELRRSSCIMIFPEWKNYSE